MTLERNKDLPGLLISEPTINRIENKTTANTYKTQHQHYKHHPDLLTTQPTAEYN
jgi:hypothetical protein